MRYGVKSHKAIIIIFGVITIFTFARQWYFGWHAMRAMSDFMAGYFLIFGFFKIIDLRGFVQIYQAYNIVAHHVTLYAYVFPFLQIGIGISYLFRVYMPSANIINFVIMSIGLISIVIKLIEKKVIPCACLGTLFQHPLSLMSLLENALMVAMSLSMVMYHFF